MAIRQGFRPPFCFSTWRSLCWQSGRYKRQLGATWRFFLRALCSGPECNYRRLCGQCAEPGQPAARLPNREGDRDQGWRKGRPERRGQNEAKHFLYIKTHQKEDPPWETGGFRSYFVCLQAGLSKHQVFCISGPVENP